MCIGMPWCPPSRAAGGRTGERSVREPGQAGRASRQAWLFDVPD